LFFIKPKVKYMSMIEYLAHYWQPLSGLAIGAVILAFVGPINWYGTNKASAIEWIAKNIFRNGFGVGKQRTVCSWL
jgi:hypothetical protein